MVGGVPLGDGQYEQLALWQVASEIVSSCRLVYTQLHSSRHYCWSLLFYCLQPRFDHWLRHLPPALTAPACRRVDRALLLVADGLLSVRVSELDATQRALLARRLRLPQRRRGCGLRSREHLVSHVAFVAGVVEASEAFLGPAGFFPMLAPLFGGADAFDAGGRRFSTFVSSCDTGARLQDAWGALQEEGLGERRNPRNPLQSHTSHG